MDPQEDHGADEQEPQEVTATGEMGLPSLSPPDEEQD